MNSKNNYDGKGVCLTTINGDRLFGIVRYPQKAEKQDTQPHELYLQTSPENIISIPTEDIIDLHVVPIIQAESCFFHRDQTGGVITLMGEINWNGRLVFLYAHGSMQDPKTFSASLSISDMLIKKSKIWEYELIKYAATHIDPVNDDIMLVDQIATNKMTISSVKRQEFADRMTLIFIDVYPDGKLYFDYALDEKIPGAEIGLYADISGNINQVSFTADTQ